ncbi:MAG: sulfatase [Gemmataceae bacterium]
MRSLFVLLALVFSKVSLTAAPPDIVVFLADDLGWGDCSIHGGRAVPTPRMAELAAEGMSLNRAFVVSPSCAPSRAALLTGLDPMRNGAMLNHARPKPEVRKWPAHFRELGYEVVAFGKVAHYAQVTGYGFDQATHFKYHEDTCIDAAVAWLGQRKAQTTPEKPAKPLCLVVGTNWPHVPWPKQGLGDPRSIAIPPHLVDTPEAREALARYHAAVARCDADLGKVREAARRNLGANHLFLFTADHGAQFPFGKWNLYDLGVRTPLVAVWPGRIRPGAVSGAMVNWTDILPTCLEAAGCGKVEGLDGRSFLGVLTGGVDRHRERVFLTHSADGEMNQYPMRGVRTGEWKYIRNLDPGAEHHTHIDKGKDPEGDGVRYFRSWVARAASDPAAAALLKRYHQRPAEELYHLAKDPAEQSNLAADPAHRETLAGLRADLDAWIRSQGDRGLEMERVLRAAKDVAKP